MNLLYTFLLCLALGVTQWFIGGTRLLFSIPGYGVLALLGVVSVASLRRTKVLPGRGCLLASAVFFAYVLGRALASPVVYLAWADLFMVLGGLIVYLITACYLTDPARRLPVLGWLLALALLNVAVGVRQFVVGDSYMLSGLGRADQYAGRASGMYICPDHLAGYLEVVGLLGLAVLLWGRMRAWVRLLLGYCVLCCFVGHLLTGSRGGFLSLCAGLVILTLLSMARVRAVKPQAFSRAVLILVIAGFVLGGVLAYGVSKSNLLKSRAGALVVRDVRFMVWPSAIKEWQTAPVLGTGAETFVYYGRRFRDPRVLADPINTHNDYLQFLGEYGVVGILGLLWFLGAHARWSWIAYRHFSLRSGDERTRAGVGGSNAAAWNIGAMSAVTAIAAHSVVDFNLHIPVNTLLMAFVFGVIANPGREISGRLTDRNARPPLLDLLPRLALPVLGVWLAAASLPHLPGAYYNEEARKALRDSEDLRGLNYASEGLKRERLDPMLFYYLGEARQALADKVPNATLSESFREAAVKPYTQALQLYPTDTRTLLRLGADLTQLDRFEEAGAVFQRALEWDPNFALTYTYYGSYLGRRGRLEEAEAAYRRAVNLSGEATAARNLQRLIIHDAASSLNN